MTNAEKYNLTEEQADKISDEFAEWHQDNSDVQGYGEALYRFLQAKAKPNLTEDEKVILRHINTINIDRIGRHDCGDLILLFKSGGFYLMTTNFNFDGLFQFIKPRRRI